MLTLTFFNALSQIGLVFDISFIWLCNASTSHIKYIKLKKEKKTNMGLLLQNHRRVVCVSLNVDEVILLSFFFFGIGRISIV